MANKSIINIDVNDEQFKAFYEHYKDFHEKVAELPDEWKAIGESALEAMDAMGDSGNILLQHYKEATDQNNELVKQLKEAKEAQRQFTLTTGESGAMMKKLGMEAKEFKETLFSIGSFLTKLGVLGIGALTGAFFGMDKLAEAATSGQRQARGLGMTTGQLNAFKVDFGTRYADESVLQGVADARSDLAKQWALQRVTGLSPSKFQNMDLGELTSDVILSAHDRWKNSPDSQHNEQFFSATGLKELGISFDQYRQWGNTPRQEIVDAKQRYADDRNKLGYGDASTDKLYQFQRELEAAGTTLQSHLIDKLADLGGPLEKFTSSLEKDAEILIDSLLTPGNIQKIGEELGDLATYLASDDFKKSAQDLITDMKNLSGATFELAKFIAHLLPNQYQLPDDQQIDPNSKEDAYSTDDLKKNPYNYSKETHNGWFSNWSSPQFQGPYYSFLNPLNPDYSKYEAQLKNLQGEFGVPANFLRAQEFAESAGVQYAISPTGARGPFQETRGMMRDYGVTDPNDFNDASAGAAKFDAALMHMFNGDMRKVAAGYGELGPGGVQALVNKYGTNWEQHVTASQEAYIKRVIGAFMSADRAPIAGKSAAIDQTTVNAGHAATVTAAAKGNQVPQVKVTVINQSGSNVAVSTNAAAAS